MKWTDFICCTPKRCCFGNNQEQNSFRKNRERNINVEPSNFTIYNAPYTSATDNIETFEEWVKQNAQNREKKRQKEIKKANKNGALRRRMLALVGLRGTQPKVHEATFWIEPAEGYPERRVHMIPPP